MMSLMDMLQGGGQNGGFAAAFVALHHGNTTKANNCWERQVREILNEVQAVSGVRLSQRQAWAVEKAIWILWPWANLGFCGAPD